MYPSYDSTAVLAPTASGALASGALASGALASGAAALRRARARAARLSLFSLLSLALAALTLAATFAPAPRGVDHPASSRAASSRAVLALGAPMGEMARAHLDAVAPRPASSGASSNTPSLETVLNADGTIRAGVSGSFDATGFALAYGADGGPRFVPRASAMADGYATINGISGTVRALAVRGSDVYVGGSFTDAGGVAAADYVARWNGTAWSALGGGVNSPVFALAVDGSGEVYVGGQFTSAYSTGATTVTGTSRVARWNASRAATDGGWATLGTGVNSVVYALAVDGSGEVYVGGSFVTAYSTGTTQVTGTRYVARWSASRAATDGGWATLGRGVNAIVNALAVDGSGEVYVGGQFASAYSPSAALVTGTSNVARWSASRAATDGGWASLGGGVSGTVLALAVDGSGEVYVGGQFASAYSTGTTTVTGTSRVARWNASRAATDGGWATLGGGVNSTVYALAVDGSGEVYVGGQFTSAYSTGTTTVTGTSRVARWNASRAATDGGWAALGGGVNNNVRALALGVGEPAPAAVSAQAPVPALYLGGDFTAANDGTVASRFTYYTGSGVLPVELTAFTATTSGRTARLSWTTVSETNNVGFTVERQTGTAWTDASAMIAGRGTTSERTDYAFNVTGLTAGRHTFRLRQTDLDGTSVVVGTVSVEIGTDGPGAVVTVLGNGSGAPRVRIEGAGVVRAEAYDVLGRRVSVLFDGEVSGTVEASLPVGVSSGAYVVRVVASGRATSHAVVVVR